MGRIDIIFQRRKRHLKLGILTKTFDDEGNGGHTMTKDHQRLTVTAKRQQKLLQKVIKLRAIPAFHYHKKVRQIERERPKAAARHLMQSDIALTEVKISLKKIKKRKSSGLDNIANGMLQNLCNSTLKTCLRFFT